MSSTDSDDYSEDSPEEVIFPNFKRNDPYERQLFLCYMSHKVWPQCFEYSINNLLPNLLACALNARKNEIPIKTRLTICEGGDHLNLSDGDVIAFPEGIVYRGLNESTVNAFVKNVLVSGSAWTFGAEEKLVGRWIFVCAHGSRSKWCGHVGPRVIEEFMLEIKSNDLVEEVFVTACAHEESDYAGNVLIFGGVQCNLVGHWYGSVLPEDVPELLHKHIIRGFIVPSIWRGKMSENIDEYWKSRALEIKRLRSKNLLGRYTLPVIEPRKFKSRKSQMGNWRSSGVIGKICGSVITISVLTVCFSLARKHHRKA